MVPAILKPAPISVVVLTYNERDNLGPLLASVSDWTAGVFVVDSGSSDGTRRMAEEAGAAVVTRPFESHVDQWRWAIENLPIETEWVLGLDADQRVTGELRDEVLHRFDAEDGLSEIAGFYIPRRQIFRGRWIRHGGYYPKYLLKLFRRDRVRFDVLDLVDHHFYVDGPTARLSGDIEENNRKEHDISFWVEKHNRYAVRLAREELLRRKSDGDFPVAPAVRGTPSERVLWLKQRWYRLPLYLRPFLYFLYRYLLRLGFLDGKQGFIFHFLHAFWYRLLVDIHLDDQLKAARAAPAPSPEVGDEG